MFEYDSALNYIHNRTEDLETKIYSPQFLKVNQLLDKEIERVTGYLGYYNPYTARFNSLKGLLYFTYNDYDSAIHYFDIAIKQITGGKQDAKGIWNTSNQVLIPTYIWKSKCIDRRYRQYQHIELLYENEQILAKAAEAWKIYIADRMEYNSLFNSNIYTPNPYPFIQKTTLNYF
jgi:tetratricopeptide (TPR) repeat protein